MLEPNPQRFDRQVIAHIQIHLEVNFCPTCLAKIVEPTVVTYALLKVLRAGGNWIDLKLCPTCQTIWVLRLIEDESGADDQPEIQLTSHQMSAEGTEEEITTDAHSLGRLPAIDDFDELEELAQVYCQSCGGPATIERSVFDLRFSADVGFLQAWHEARVSSNLRDWLIIYFRTTSPSGKNRPSSKIERRRAR